MKEFNDFQHNVGVQDLGFNGPTYTWCNNNPDELIWERLDRALANNAASTDSNIVVTHGIRTLLDHCPIICKMVINKRIPSAFKFQSMWLTHDDINRVVNKAWSTQSHYQPLHKLMFKLKATKEALKLWNKEVFGLLHNRIKSATAILADLERNAQYNYKDIRETKKNYEVELFREEIFLKDKSSEHWLKAGDKNTAYFAACIKDKQRRFQHSIKDANGGSLTETSDIIKEAVNHFSRRFTASHCELDDEILDCIQCCVSQADNEMLTAIPSFEEVRDCVREMNPHSAPGLEGFNGLFFQHFWHLIGKDFHEAVVDFFRRALP